MTSGKNHDQQSSPNKERLLTLSEAAEVLRFSRRTLREYLKRGEIKGKLIGNRWRFRRADLDAFFDNAPSDWDFARKSDHGD
jgi:excisionase family DNA binding protein